MYKIIIFWVPHRSAFYFSVSNYPNDSNIKNHKNSMETLSLIISKRKCEIASGFDMVKIMLKVGRDVLCPLLHFKLILFVQLTLKDVAHIHAHTHKKVNEVINENSNKYRQKKAERINIKRSE